MKWLLNWVASVVMIHVLGYYYRFYSSLSELISGIDSGAFLVVLLVGGFTASMGMFGALLIKKVFDKWVKIEGWWFLSTSLILSVIFCIPIMHKIHLVLTET